MTDIAQRQNPPAFCQYAGGPCDQDFSKRVDANVFFLYPSDPTLIAGTVEAAIHTLRGLDPAKHWVTWKDLPIAGQIIYCEVCKTLRFSTTVVADVTTLNFNLLFEIGYAIGLGLPVIPIRDTAYIRDKRQFDELGLLDTLGYLDFQNSNELVRLIRDRLPGTPLPPSLPELSREQPLFIVKGHIDTEGAVKLMSALKKSPLRFRTFDPRETARLSIHEARRQVSTSLGVITHLLSPERTGALVHNARCAFVAGLAMAGDKAVLMLQEGDTRQPIDYRDVVRSYTDPAAVPDLLAPIIREVVIKFQDTSPPAPKLPPNLLETVDLGDVAAENEIRPLRAYFVPTAQYNDARRGYARLVVGRKGAGKTAIFYAVRDAYSRRRSHLVLDLKPEGHQFTKLREAVLSYLTPGLQEHTLTAFWNYLLLCEIAHKIVEDEISPALRDPDLRPRFERVQQVYRPHLRHGSGDFSERLLSLVDRIAKEYGSVPEEVRKTGKITEQIFTDTIRGLDDALAEYLSQKEEVWLLFDNLDKGWPTRGATAEDILIVRCLLEATRKIQRQLERRGVQFRCLVLLRNDIYEHLILETPDKGKDTAISLDWDDHELFREIVKRRIEAGTNLRGSFPEVWGRLVTPNVGAEDSFGYILARSLMRPRDVLNFVRRAFEVAINRGHKTVTEEDIRQAQDNYSEDLLQDLAFEIKDVYPTYPDLLYTFLGCPVSMAKEEALKRLVEADMPRSQAEGAFELLVWFGFLGVRSGLEGDIYAYDVRYNLTKLLAPVDRDAAPLVVHPGFRSALVCTDGR